MGKQLSSIRIPTVSGLGSPQAITFDGTHIHLADTQDDNVRMILPPSANGQAATVYTYTVSGLNNPQGITFDGDSDAPDPPDPANNAPSFSESSYAFTDVAIAVNTVVGTVAATDADDDTLSYSLTGTDASNFAIDSDGEITVATALTNSTTYNFNVVADDQTDTTSVAVTVTAIAAVVPLTASFTSYPTSQVSPDFHVVLEFSRAINPASLVATDLRLRSQQAQFHNPQAGDVDFYTDDNITFLIVMHMGDRIPAGSQQYLVRLPANRVTYQDDDDNTQTGATATVNTPQFAISSTQTVTPTITYSDSEGQAGTATTATVTFNQPVSGVTLDDFSIVDGTLGNAVTVVSGSEYTVQVTPLASGDGTMTLTFAEDGTYEGNTEASADLTYTGVTGALSFGSETIANQTWTVGTAVNLTLPEATGGTGAITYSLSPTTPDGVTFTAGTRVLAGTPTGRFTSATFTYTATAGTESVTLTFTIVVTAPAITIPAIANQTWTVGTAVSLTLPAASGGVGDFTYSLSPALPAGVSRTNRAVTGTPTTAVTVATYTYTAEDSEGVTQTRTFTIVVNAVAAPVELNWEVPTEAVGNIFSVTLTSNYPLSDVDVGDFRLRDDDNTHPIIPLNSSNTTIVQVSGTNNVRLDIVLTGTYDDDYTVRVNGGTLMANGMSVPAAQLVSAAFRIETLSFGTETIDDQSWEVGTAITALTLPEASGGDSTKTYSLSPALPSGIAFAAATRILSGNPTAVFTLATFTYTVTDGAGSTDDLTFTIVVVDVPIVNNAPEFSLSSYTFLDVAIAINTVVGTVAATDADNDTLSYSLTGTDAADFAIDSSGEITAAAALNYDETYNITVVADDGTDTASVAVTIGTQTLSIPPGILLFKKQLNRTTTPAAAGDNDYSTYTSTNTITISIDKDGDAQMFDTLFFKVMNVTSYVAEVDGTALPSRTVPQNLTGVTELGDVSIVRHGYQHDLYELSSAQSGSTVEITFTGTNIRVSEVWVLKKIAALEKLTELAHTQIDRDSEPQNNLYGYDEIEVNTGLDRLRWQSAIGLEFTHTDENYEVFLDMIEDHAETGIVVAQEPRRLPWRTYQAIFSQLSHAAPYLCEARPAGNTVKFSIDETRDAAALWYAMDTFNSNDSGDGLMFFKPCAHLFENGAVDDNDYETHSTETTHTFDTEAVSHIFVKAKGVTGFAVQTRVSNAWVTQETITPTQKAYRGYDNSLTKLTTRLVADRVRLVFTGTNMEIYEVMCLDRGGEILTDTQSLLSKTDRTGIIHEGQGGGLDRSRVEGSQRMKWGIEVNATFGHFDDFIVDDVLDWINAYPNFVFSYLPNEFPWRTFPATWTDQRFQQAFLTTILQHGDYLQMNVKER